MADYPAAPQPAIELPTPPEVSGLPALWPGYVSAVVFLVGEFVFLSGNPEAGTPEPTPSALLLINLAGWFYWLHCVYRFHDVMSQIPGYDHPITPWRAVGMHWVPLYNFYWVFKWPSEIATFVNWRTQSEAMKGPVAGVLVLLAVLVGRFVDGFLGLLLLFGAGTYISRQIRRAFAAPPVPASALAPPGVKSSLGL